MKISLVLLHYNRKNLLIKTLDSIMNSSVSKNDLEIIIIDDASTEEHSIKEIDSLFPELKFKTHFFNYEEKWWLCPVIPLNKGISMATGDVVVFLCGECMLIGDVILDIKKRIKPNDYLVYATLSLTKEETDFISLLSYPEILKLNPGGHMWYQHSIHNNSQLNFCTSICKSDLDELGGFDERYGWGVDFGDADFLQRIKRKGMNITSIDNPLTYHQHHEKVIYIETEQRRYKFPSKNQIFDEKLYDYVLTNEPNNIKVINSFTSMRVDKIIFSIDDNPEYDGFWEVNSEICKNKLGITPVLFRITDNDSDFYEDKWGIVKNVKAIPNINTGFQAQIYRMYATKFFENECVMTNDIDMLLFNKDFITENIKDIPAGDLVILNSDAYDPVRPECVGVYSGPDRYPICYVVGKGSTFNKIINNNVSFDEYCNRLIKLDLNWDTDEIYFGKCVNSQKEVTVHKVIRGYSTNFFCPNRIERHNFNNSGIFSIDLEKNINLDTFIDCHCARPYIQHKIAIDNIKNAILKKEKKEIYLIGCHIENERQKELLYELVEFLEKNNKKFVLTSHTTIPDDIIKKSVGFIYDSDNPKYKTWDLKGFPKFVFRNENFNIESPYITYGASDYYHVGVIRLIINGLKYLKTLDYDIAHWIEYDSIPVIEMDTKANELLNENDFIFYGIGTRFSFNLSKVNDEFISMNNDEIFKNLSENNYLAEQLIGNKLTSGSKKTIFLNEEDRFLWGRYSQNFNNQKINFSLFESGNDVNIFITNISSDVVNVLIEHRNEIISKIEIYPNVWFLRQICFIGDAGDLKISLIEKDNKIAIMDENLGNPKKYESIVKSVNFIGK